MNESSARSRSRRLPFRDLQGLLVLGLGLTLGACHAPANEVSPQRAAAVLVQPASSVPAAPPASAPTPADVAGARPPSPTRRYLVAAIGDSLSDPRAHGGGYLEYVQSRCPNLEIDNFGRGGAMVNQIRRTFDEQIAHSSRPYTHLVVFGGVNDLYSDLTAHRTPQKIESDLAYLYAAARARQMQVVAITVAPWGGFKRYFNESRSHATSSLNAWILACPAAGQVDFAIDAHSLLACGDPDVLCPRFALPFKDGIHFGPAGHRVLGEALYRAAFSGCS